MRTVREGSSKAGSTHVSCFTYQNLNNISHFHSDYELVYVHKGTADITIGEKTFLIRENEGIFIVGEEIHRISSDEHTVTTVLKVDRAFFEKRFASKALLTPIISEAAYISETLRRIKDELRSEADNRFLMADTLATELFILLFRRETCTSDARQLLSRSNSHTLYIDVCRKIAAEYNTVTFDGMAAHMHFSKPYFSKVFHSMFGMTFTQYVNTVKVAAVIERIKEGKTSITEAALSCGFNTIRNFNRVFKRLTGYTPSELPHNYVFLYSLQNGYELDPTLNCTRLLEE